MLPGAEHVHMCFSTARVYDQLAQEYRRLALDLIEGERLKRNPKAWAEFKREIGLDDDDIETLRDGVGMVRHGEDTDAA